MRPLFLCIFVTILPSLNFMFYSQIQSRAIQPNDKHITYRKICWLYFRDIYVLPNSDQQPSKWLAFSTSIFYTHHKKTARIFIPNWIRVSIHLKIFHLYETLKKIQTKVYFKIRSMGTMNKKINDKEDFLQGKWYAFKTEC